jgi:hypothetical protein
VTVPGAVGGCWLLPRQRLPGPVAAYLPGKVDAIWLPVPWSVAATGGPLTLGRGRVGSSHGAIFWSRVCHTSASPRLVTLGTSGITAAAGSCLLQKRQHACLRKLARETGRGGDWRLAFLHHRPTKSPAVLNPSDGRRNSVIGTRRSPAVVGTSTTAHLQCRVFLDCPIGRRSDAHAA